MKLFVNIISYQGQEKGITHVNKLVVCRNRVVSPISANKIGLFQFSIQPYVIIYIFF